MGQHCAPEPAGWWCWADALVYQHAVVGDAYPFKYNWPGIGELCSYASLELCLFQLLHVAAVATIACIMINMLPRRDLAEAGESWEEGSEVSSSCLPERPCQAVQASCAPLVLQTRARLWLFVSFLMAAGAVAGSVAVLVATQGKDLGFVGVVRACCACCTSAAALCTAGGRSICAICRGACCSAASSWRLPYCFGLSAQETAIAMGILHTRSFACGATKL